MFPKVMKAAAGPHDLGPGDRYYETFSGIIAGMVPYNEDSTMYDLDPVAGHDSDLELYHHDSSVCRPCLQTSDPDPPRLGRERRL